MLKVDGISITLGFAVGAALGYLAYNYWKQNGRAG